MMTRTETRDERDRVLNTMTFVNFLRGIQIDEDVGEPAPTLDLPAGPARRFAPVHDDHLPRRCRPELPLRRGVRGLGTYHIDDTVAREAGFPA